MNRVFRRLIAAIALGVGAWLAGPAPGATICPFCDAIAPTLAEQIARADAVVVVVLDSAPTGPPADPTQVPKGTFRVVDIIKGSGLVSVGDKLEALLIGKYEPDDQFLITGVDPPSLAWSTPVRTSPRVQEYLKGLASLPPRGTERLIFVQQYLEDEEGILADDAYNEFAQASYAEVAKLRDHMDHDRLVAWLQDPNVLKSRKRLYYTMLGVCGRPEDVTWLEEVLSSGDPQRQTGLDAMVACYLKLRGPDGLPIIEKNFLANPEMDYPTLFGVVQALRFHATETEVIPPERIAESLRLVLAEPQNADLVIPDLARLQDWSVVDRLVEMFKATDDQTKWIRVPIVNYLMACPLPEAKTYVEELRKLDPNSVRRAEMMADFDLDDAADAAAPDEPSGGAAKSSETPGATPAKPPAKDGGDGASIPSSPDSDSTDESVPRVTGSRPVSRYAIDIPVSGTVPGRFVSTVPPVTPAVAEDGPTDGAADAETRPTTDRLGDAQRPAPARTWTILVSSFVGSGVLFVLMWSILCGWFDRLLF